MLGPGSAPDCSVWSAAQLPHLWCNLLFVCMGALQEQHSFSSSLSLSQKSLGWQYGLVVACLCPPWWVNGKQWNLVTKLSQIQCFPQISHACTWTDRSPRSLYDCPRNWVDVLHRWRVRTSWSWDKCIWTAHWRVLPLKALCSPHALSNQLSKGGKEEKGKLPPASSKKLIHYSKGFKTRFAFLHSDWLRRSLFNKPHVTLTLNPIISTDAGVFVLFRCWQTHTWFCWRLFTVPCCLQTAIPSHAWGWICPIVDMFSSTYRSTSGPADAFVS